MKSLTFREVLLSSFIIFFFLCDLTCIFVKCREAIKPPADVGDVLKENNQHRPINVNTNGPPCTLDVQKDLPKPKEPQPLYIVPNTNQFWLPNAKGQLQIPRGAAIELYCTKTFANTTEAAERKSGRIPKNTRTIKPICLEGKQFLWHDEKYEFHQFVCAQPPTYLVERLGEQCAIENDGDAQFYRIGFNITNGRFLETMRFCHDDATLRTHYTQYRLTPANVHFQKYVKRLNFSQAGFFKSHNINYLYTQYNQRQQAAQVLGDEHTKYFDNNTLFLARGHLAAKSDLIYANQQRTTFTFFNVAPQWQSFNGGQWAALEDEVRKYVSKMQLNVDCYTGTWGVMELPIRRRNGGATSEQRQFYLSYDANNNGLLPVPQLYYRIIVERTNPSAAAAVGLSRRGIALIGINNPHATMHDIQQSYVLCNDVREEVPWLRWIRNTKNLKKGYLYACRVNELAEAVGHLPAQLNNVHELLK